MKRLLPVLFSSFLLLSPTIASSDTYAPHFCEFSISPTIIAERRMVHDQFGEAEVAEYYSKKGVLKAQCARILHKPWPDEALASYLTHIQKSSGVSHSGWSTFQTPVGRAISLKGNKVVQGYDMKIWILGIQGKRSLLVLTVIAKVEDFIPDFAWNAIQNMEKR